MCTLYGFLFFLMIDIMASMMFIAPEAEIHFLRQLVVCPFKTMFIAPVLPSVLVFTLDSVYTCAQGNWPTGPNDEWRAHDRRSTQ